ncbi:adenylyl-sulfate kinase [Pyrococcus kukulkanii]|uniref:adenylyl-sulfate kinase n=1 Tax=Pyrococcus kukulkanii TaxID=1609559 RepID=UPI00356403B8
MKPVLITFSGIDGSGKTTLAKRVSSTLSQRGYRVKLMYGRHLPLILKPIINIGKRIFMKNVDFFEKYVTYRQKKLDILSTHSFLGEVYKYLLIFDYFIQMGFKVFSIAWSRPDFVIFDRYYYDTVILDLALDFGYSPSRIIEIIGIFTKIFGTPDYAFLVDVPEEVAYKRKDDVPSIYYLKERRKLYKLTAKRIGWTTLDGEENLETLTTSVIRTVLGDKI